jgi:two-component system phosphate regulon response regulator PhoB
MATPPRKRVLIAEDDDFLRKACEDGLQSDGYEVIAARDGEAALRSVRADQPDVVLLDWLLPKMTGLEVLREVKADRRSRDLPILILSNSARGEDRKRALELGAAAYLIKDNLSLHGLRDRIKGLLKAS